MPKICHISDWHTDGEAFARRLDWEIRAQNLDQPDLVLITGDMIINFAPPDQRSPNAHWRNDEEEMKQRPHYERMVEYVDSVWPGVDTIAVSGNHDWCEYGVAGSVFAFDRPEGDMLWWNNYKIAGFRGVHAWFGFWRDELAEDKIKILCDRLPEDTDILVTHDAPHRILDDTHDVRCACGKMNCHDTHLFDPNSPNKTVIEPRNIGGVSLREWIDAHPNLKLHCFGHIHEQGGNVQVRNQTVFSNAAGTLNTIVLPPKQPVALKIEDALKKARK